MKQVFETFPVTFAHEQLCIYIAPRRRRFDFPSKLPRQIADIVAPAHKLAPALALPISKLPLRVARVLFWLWHN